MQWNISSGLVRLLFIVFPFMFLSPLMADVMDGFDSPKLNPELWEIKVAGKASYTIDNGILTMTSPNVEGSIILYFPQNIADLEINFEVKMDTSTMGDHIVMGGIAKLMEPATNLEIGYNWLSLFLLVPGSATLKQDPDKPGQAFPPTDSEVPYQAGWRVFEIRFERDKTVFVIDGNEVGKVDKNKSLNERYFHISPDDFTTHYMGEVKIDYIKISGPGSVGLLAVDSLGKLATSWAKMKVPSTYP